MSKKHFKYNPKTLSYDKVEISFGKRVFQVILVLAPSILFGALFAYFFTRRINSPKEKELLAERDRYVKELKILNKRSERVAKVLNAMQARDEELYRQALHAKEFPEELRLMGAGGSDKYDYLSDLPNSELMISTSMKLDQLERRLNAQSMSFTELLKLAKNQEQMLACVPAIQPVRNSDLKKRISGFGWRIDPIYRTRRMHSGVDFTAKRGTEVYVTGDGVIEELEVKRWGYGKSIIVNHGFGYKTRYAHLKGFNVKRGQKVKRGELIGFVGSTGKSTGPHLHYEVVKEGSKVNPIGYFHHDLSPSQYEQLLEMSENSHETMD